MRVSELTWPWQVFLVHRGAYGALVPLLGREITHELVPVDAVEQGADGTLVLVCGVCGNQQRQVAALIPAAQPLALLDGGGALRGQRGRAVLHRLRRVQHEVVLPSAKKVAALLRGASGQQEQQEEQR